MGYGKTDIPEAARPRVCACGTVIRAEECRYDPQLWDARHGRCLACRLEAEERRENLPDWDKAKKEGERLD